MAIFAPPVRRENFLYSSVLYADAGNQNHHPRATVAELTALLRPEAPTKTKKKTAQPAAEPPKDQVGHWYTAQLIHYGLPVTKDKNAAKVRLLNALNEGKLEVLASIKKLESELKKEWEAENRKLKKAAKGSDGGTARATSQGAGTKRKRNQTDGPGNTELTGRPKAKPKQNPTGTANKPATPVKRPNQKKSETPVVADPAPRTSTKTKIPYYGPFSFDFYPAANNLPPAYPFSGAYGVSCPRIEQDWPRDSIEEFTLAFSPFQDQLWSRFKWGDYEGIITIDSVPKTVPNKRGVLLKWRARRLGGLNTAEGTGKAVYSSKSAFKGELHGFFHLGLCDFEATKRGTARRGNRAPDHEPSHFWFTTIADRIREEWSQMDSVMRDVGLERGPIPPPPPAGLTKSKLSGTGSKTTASSSKQAKEHPVSNTNQGPERKPKGPVKPRSGGVKVEGADHHAYSSSITLSGTYQLFSADVATIYGLVPDDLELTLCKDAPGDRWWAFFAWGPLEGLIKLSPGPDMTTLDQPHTLGWRIRNTDTGRLEFGRGCTGEMIFGRDGTIEGILHNVEGNPIEFSGSRMEERGPPQCHPEDIAEEWDDFPKQAYGRT